MTAAVTDPNWGPRRPLDDRAWRHVFDMLARVDMAVARRGLSQALHPQVGTVVQDAGEVLRVLEASDVGWCLDTGHLAIGGLDPVEFASAAAGRVRHVHLKDVRMLVGRRAAVERGDIGEPNLVRISSRDPAPPPLAYLRVAGGIFPRHDHPRHRHGEVPDRPRCGAGPRHGCGAG